MPPMLGPIPPREGAAKACAAQIRAAILRGELAAGSRLPPERALAGTLGVNRATVRAALHELEQAGLVTARQGSGYAVHDYRSAGRPDLLGPLADVARDEGRLAELAADLLAVRRHLARAVLERLAGRRVPRAARERLAARIDELAAAVEAGAPLAAIAQADLAITACLLDATESPALRLFWNPAASVLARVPELAAAVYATPADNVAGWRALAAMLDAQALDVDVMLGALEARDRDVVLRLRRAKGGRS